MEEDLYSALTILRDYALNEVRKASNLLETVYDIYAGLVGHPAYDQARIAAMREVRKADLLTRYSSEMSDAEAELWEDLIKSFDEEHHAGDRNV